ncbi:MAG: FlgD immunoglobulin-like domain containing protein, partial [Candidatus Latescibacterota bacterium]
MHISMWNCQRIMWVLCLIVWFSVLPGNAAYAQLTIDLKFSAYDMRFSGVSSNDRTGMAVALCDINGDGRSDYAIGAPGFDYPGRADCGMVYVIVASDTLASDIDLRTLRQDLIRIIGPSAGAQLGAVLATANIDGGVHEELLCGMPSATVNGKFSAGRVAVIFGAPSLADTIDLASSLQGVTMIDGENVFDKLGSSLASGDINDDGFGEIVAGAPFASPPAKFAAGKVFVVYGDLSLPRRIDLAAPTSPVTKIFGEASNATFGTSCAAGDVNGDSNADIVVGAPQTSIFGRAAAGVVYVIPGSSSLPATIDIAIIPSGITRIFGDVAGDLTGLAVALGRVTGHSSMDLVFSAPEHTLPGRTRSGTVYMIPGGTLLPDSLDLKWAPDYVVDLHGPVSNDAMGIALEAADLNADGFEDLLIGAPNASPLGRSEAGKVYLFFGRAVFHTFYDFSARPPGLTRILGAAQGARAGGALAGAHANGDNRADLMIGARNGIRPDGLATGVSYVILGNDQITPAQLVYYEAAATQQRCELTWELSEPVDPARFVIERHRESGPATTLPTDWIEQPLVSRYVLCDNSVSQGVTYSYRIYLEERFLFAVEVAVPAIRTFLQPNFPNPFRHETTIPFCLAEKGHVDTKIYDVRGTLVAAIANGIYSQGQNSIRWNGLNSDGEPAPSGIYFVSMRFKGKTFKDKIVL